MLELRPTCEHCNRVLPPESTEAMPSKTGRCIVSAMKMPVAATTMPSSAALSSNRTMNVAGCLLFRTASQ